MPEQIIITIDENAETKVEVKGHAGAGCKALTEALEKALGETTQDTKTHEYHQRATQGAQQKARA
jgi:hypothetical protein